MALKKPSDLFEKKETSGVFEPSDVSFEIAESYDKFRNNFEKVNELSQKVEVLSKELSEKLNKTDLENAMLSQLMVLDENFKSLQNQVKGLNKQDLKEFKETVYNLTDIVENLVEIEIPKYKKKITKNEFVVGEQINQLQEIVEENIIGIRGEIDTKFDNIAEAVDNNINYFNQQLQETSSQVKKTTETYNKLSKIVENKVSKENEKFDEYSELIENLSQAFEELSVVLKEELSVSSQLTEEKFEEYKKEVNIIQNDYQSSVDVRLENYRKELVEVKADVVINEQHIKNVDKYLQEHHQELVELKEEVFGEIEKLSVGDLQENLERLEKKLDYIKETYSQIEPEVLVKEVIKEGLLNEPPETKNEDPLTPLNQNFVTLDQLQGHYRLFINRIQQQLATLGGGGETRLRYLDDVVGVATNSSAYDGKYLQWNSTTNTAEFTTVSGGGVQVNSDWNATTGISSILNKPTIVNQIVAGSGITISPASGVGIVTISATATGTGAATTGYYGSFYDTTTQSTTGVGVTTKISLGTTALTNGFHIENGTRIVAENAGIYDTQFSFQLDKSAGATGHVWIWLSKNGVDLPETNSVVATQGTNAEVVPAWNFIVDMIAGDYIEYKWMSDDANIQILSTNGVGITSVGNPPVSVNIPAIPSAIVSIQQIAGVVAGVGSTTQTLNQTLQYGNTSSLGMSVGVVTASSFVKSGGTSSQFLKADGSVDTATYATQTYVGLATAGLLSSTGNGSALTGIVTYITAGSGISINQSTGNVTITATGGGGGGGSVGLTIKDEGGTVGTAGSVFTLNFVGDNVTATASGTASTITVATQTYVATAGVATYASTAGIATVAQNLTGSPNITVSSVNSSGIVTASSFSGSGSNLTGIVTYITAGSGISVNQNTGNVTITNVGAALTGNNVFTGINTFTGSNTFSGSIIIEQASEAFNKYSTTINAAAVVNLDCSTGNIHYITSTVGGNWTTNLTNVGITSGHCANYTLVINQGTTAYIPNALQIAGVTTSINWQGGSIPTGNNNKKDVIAYTVFDDAGVYTVFGQLVTFG